MILLQSTNSLLKHWHKLIFLLFAFFAFFIIQRVYVPHLLYLNLQPFFAFDTAFYEYHFDFKSGYLSLLSQFFLQFLYYPVTGSFILVALLILLALVFRKIFLKTIELGFVGIEFIAPVFILYQLKNYTAGLESLMVLLISGIFYILADLAKLNAFLKAVYLFLAMYLAFLLFGIEVSFVLGLVYFTDELIHVKSIRSVLLRLLIPVYFVILSYMFYDLNLVNKLGSQFSFSDPGVLFPGFWYLCIYIAFAFLLELLPMDYFTSKIPEKRKQIILLFTFPIILVIICSISYPALFVNQEKYKAEIDYYVANKQWDKVLLLKDKLGSEDRIARFQMNRALSATGRLSEDLFSVPQEWGEYGLLLTKEISRYTLPYESDLCYDYGYMKASKYWMIEFQTYTPYTPRSLNRLAMSSLLLGEYSTSRKYFIILGKSIIYRKYANDMLESLRKDPAKLKNKYTPGNIAIIRDDNAINLRNPDSDLINVLKYSPKNKMAYEYLMSYYILRGDLDNFYRFLKLVTTSGYYKKMPKTYEEVLLLYYEGKQMLANTWDYPVSKEMIERYKEYKKTVISNRNSKVNLREVLKPGFGDTFWYYMYMENPKSMGDKIKKTAS